MKKTKLTLALAGLLIAGGAIVSSCKKSTTTTPPAQDTNASTASDNNMAEQHSNDVENIGAEAVDNGSLSTFRLANGGASVSSTGSYSVTGFGTGNVTVTFYQYTGNDGHTRNGSINYTITGGTHYRDPGMVITVSTSTLNPYTVDNNTVTISKSITNNGLVGGNMKWSITSNLTIAKASGGTFTWNTVSRTHVLLNTNAITYGGVAYAAAYNGTTTPITWGNTATAAPYNGAIVQIDGTATGTSADGVAYSVTTTGVVRNHNCTPDPITRPHFHPFVAGTISFTPGSKTPRVINFGTGACDMTYTISIGSWSETITW
jgi:hypothetical protein